MTYTVKFNRNKTMSIPTKAIGEATVKARTILPREKTQEKFSMAVGNVELVHECFPKRLSKSRN